MSTVTTIALDRLIERKASKSMAAGKNVSDSRQGSPVNATNKQPDSTNTPEIKERKHHWTQISPALYTTPEPTPLPDLPDLPDSPSSFTQSPYIVNHKGRGPRIFKTFSEDNVALHEALVDVKMNGVVRSLEAKDVESSSAVNGIHEDVLRNGKISNDETAGEDDLKPVMLEQDNEMDDFFDPQDSLSVRSSIDGESSFGLERSLNLNSSVSEFYDAWEELSSESGSQPSRNEIETELHELRLNFLLEMEKRKQAEDQKNDMRNQWEKIREQLSLVGLKLPLPEDQFANDLDLSDQVNVIRFVSNSIGRGIVKAEVEAEMESQLEAKNFEIARLLDKLRYYEAVNHEMCQRNQESIETMRGARQRRKRRQRWIWGSIVAAVTVGSAALVWSYVPTEKGLFSAPNDENVISRK